MNTKRMILKIIFLSYICGMTKKVIKKRILEMATLKIRFIVKTSRNFF